MCAWATSGVDVLGKALPSLMAGLKYPASTGEALDSIVELANASNATGDSSATLDKVLLDSVKNKEVSLQVYPNDHKIILYDRFLKYMFIDKAHLDHCRGCLC